ncbi:uncharacterized protein [Miscanthus floridulus]|uniref:uncharacterized protein n=1 Tax=Miscanthus floridulus TaxID=154761 RepID=UPI00345A868B
MASQNKEGNTYHAAVGGNGYGGTVNMAPPTATAPAKPEPPMVMQHAKEYTTTYTAYPAPHRRPPAPYLRPQKPPWYYGGGDGYCDEQAAGAYGGGYYRYRSPQPPPYGGGGYGYCPSPEFGWGARGGGYSYYDGGYGGGGYGGGDGYGGGGYGGGGYGGGGGGGYGGDGYGRPPAYGAYEHHMREHHQRQVQGHGHGHGHGHGGDGPGSCGGGCSPGSCAAIHGEFEHEHHTKFKHSTARHDGKCSENDGKAPHVTELAETK